MSESPVQPCQVCETADRSRVILRLPACEVVRCGRCGFVYLNGDRSLESERPKYEIDHHDEGGYLQKFDIDRIVGEQMESVESMLKRAGTSLAGFPAGTAALDVGCSRGHFLAALSRRFGKERLLGVDVSERMVEWGRRELGLDLRAAPIEEIELPAGGFDLVTMFDVLEHVARPRDVLRRIVGSLKPGGWMILEVPGEVTTFRTLAKLAYRLTGGRLRRPLQALYHPTHLSYFTRGSLARLIESVGGERVDMRNKEAHITRFGLRKYAQPTRSVIRGVALFDKVLGTEAKLLCGFRRPGAPGTNGTAGSATIAAARS